MLVALLWASGLWLYVLGVLVPYQRADAATHGRPRGNLSDLYPRWLGTRELFLRHRDPYSPEITQEIQAGYYGRVLDPNRPADPKDQQAFAYPVYVAFLLAPTVGLAFEPVGIGFEWLLIAMTGASVWLWLSAMGWRPEPQLTWSLIALTLGSFPAVQGFRLQQLSLLVAFLIALSVALLLWEWQLASGLVLAVATIKPQLAVPIALCLLLWAVSEVGTRQKFIWGFLVTMGVLVGGGEWLLPGWLGRFSAAVREYRHYTGGRSMLDLMLPSTLAKAATMIIILGMAALGWRWRKAEAGTEPFGLMIALVLVGTLLVIPSFAPYNQLLLLPAILLAGHELSSLWQRGWASKVALLLAGGAIAWQWLAALGLDLALLVMAPAAVQQGWWLPLYAFVKLPFPIVCLAPLGFLMAPAWRGAPGEPRHNP